MNTAEIAEQLGYVLSTSHELSTNILNRLSYRDLIKATQVCQTWNKIGIGILDRQRKIRFMALHHSDLLTADRKSLWQIDARTEIPIASSIESLGQFLNRLPPLPYTYLGFANEEMHRRVDIKTKNGRNSSTLYRALKEKLCRNSSLAVVYAPMGVVGTVQKSTIEEIGRQNPVSDDKSSSLSNDASDICEYRNNEIKRPILDDVGYSIEMEDDAYESLSLVAIPRQSGVQINVINLDDSDFLKKYRPEDRSTKNLVISDEEFNSICQLSPCEPLKAVLMFCCDSKDPVPKAFKLAAINRQNGKFALGGGMIDGVQLKDSEVLKSATAIVFSGKNVTAATIVVSRKVKTIDDLRAKLTKFSDFYDRGSQSMCFLFSCCGRDRLWYTHGGRNFSDRCYDTECLTFRQLFPKVPIFGFIGGGEIGMDYIPRESTLPDDPKRRKKLPLSNHEFTAIFVMISIL